MRNLAPRIERLEEVYSPAEIIVIMLTHFGEGEITGGRAMVSTSLASLGSLKVPLRTELLLRHRHTTTNIHP